ncbi:MAG: recombination regulator RecX [Rhodoferax sp.]|jgi:regulatory protein|nr:recombination regulator RecX [Rhodoferax sp.]
MALPPLSLKGRALRLLGTREHSRAELERKLAAHATEPAELARTLDELQAKGFISAQRVVDSVLHRRAARLGAARIRQELQQKGLEPALVRDAVAGLQATELQRAQAVWHKKFGASPPADGPAERARQMRFLAARGFGGDTIRRVVRGAADDDTPAPGDAVDA